MSWGISYSIIPISAIAGSPSLQCLWVTNWPVDSLVTVFVIGSYRKSSQNATNTIGKFVVKDLYSMCSSFPLIVWRCNFYFNSNSLSRDIVCVRNHVRLRNDGAHGWYIRNNLSVNNCRIVVLLKYAGIVPFICLQIFWAQSKSTCIWKHLFSPHGKLVWPIDQYSKILSSASFITWLTILLSLDKFRSNRIRSNNF